MIPFLNPSNDRKKSLFSLTNEKKADFNSDLIYFNSPIRTRKKKTTNFAPICERVYF
jgi:hypothetical protein